MLDTRYEQRDTRMATEEIVLRYFLIRSHYLMRNQAEPFALFIPEHTIIPHHSIENSESKSIVRYGLHLLRNWNLFVRSLYRLSAAISGEVDSKGRSYQEILSS